MEESVQAHWENIYKSKSRDQFSWTQQDPQPSLDMILSVTNDTRSPLIDVGGGESLLTRHLLKNGFSDLSVLDISNEALEFMENDLNEFSVDVKMIHADIRTYKPDRKYDLWHDRAAFHFLTAERDIARYARTAAQGVNTGGHLIIGTFSTNGPESCSGLPVTRYDEEKMKEVFREGFEFVSSRRITHITPTGNSQAFIFGIFIRI